MKQCALLGCNRSALADPQAQGFCILHAPWDGKDLSAFQAAIEEIIQDAKKSKICDFSHCYFPPNYDCRDLKQAFKFSCIFQGSKFVGNANFLGAEFFGNAYFWKAEFVGSAEFGYVKFLGETAFGGTNFARSVSFIEVKFLRSAYFVEAKFSGDADFIKAEFSGDANFGRVEFAGTANFMTAKFSGDTYFEEAKFSGNTHFEQAEFRQRASFSKVQTAKYATVDFQEVRLLKPQQVFFHHVDLSRWSFLDTDLRRIDFDDVTWGSIRRLWSRRTAIFDEIRVSNKEVEKEYLAKVERLYRHLKQNYESQRDYGRAGDFYYGEMEMKRCQLGPLG